MMAAPGADTFVDITDTIDRKIDALRAHDSQHPDPAGLDERIRAWGAMTAQSAGFPEGRYAEGFLRIDTA